MRRASQYRSHLSLVGLQVRTASTDSRKSLQVLERALDLSLGVPLLLISLPLMVLTTIAIKVEDGMRAPVLARQHCVDRHQQRFMVFKFRTRDCESDPCSLQKHIGVTRGIAALTRVGRVIRPAHINRLPKIFNVLRGELSLIRARRLGGTEQQK